LVLDNEGSIPQKQLNGLGCTAYRKCSSAQLNSLKAAGVNDPSRRWELGLSVHNLRASIRSGLLVGKVNHWSLTVSDARRVKQCEEAHYPHLFHRHPPFWDN
jgi:hypothetical protein